jgi:hypothetical protein
MPQWHISNDFSAIISVEIKDLAAGIGFVFS